MKSVKARESTHGAGEGVPSAPRRWEVRIDGYRPTTVNELLRTVRGRIRLKKDERLVVVRYVELAGVVPATGKRRVSLRIRIPKGQRRWDGDGLWKGLLDGLKHAGAIVNDSPDWVEQGPIDYERGGRLSTTILLEDLP